MPAAYLAVTAHGPAPARSRRQSWRSGSGELTVEAERDVMRGLGPGQLGEIGRVEDE
jgi:hypothetical protein